MLIKTAFPIARVRVPVKRAKTLDAAKVQALAESILTEGQLTPIRVRADGEDFVLIEGLHRLEALKALAASHAFATPEVLFAKIADEEREDWQKRFAGVRA